MRDARVGQAPGPFSYYTNTFNNTQKVVVAGVLTCSPSSSSTGLSSSSSALSSSAPTLSSSSSTSSAAAFSDPRFVGFWGQSFYVGGVVGGVYSLLSDAEVQLNAMFVYRTNISCPVVEGRVVDNCFQHKGTYFGSVAVRVQGGEWVVVAGGGVEQGFSGVTLSDRREVHVGEEVSMGQVGGSLSQSRADDGDIKRRLRAHTGDSSLTTPPTSSTVAPALSVHRVSHRRLLVCAGTYSLTIDNMDGYVDLTAVDVTCWRCITDELQPEGLLGRTWDATVEVGGQAGSSDAEAEQYRERDDDLTGCNTARGKHCRTSFVSQQH